jgi:Ca-activated chloride channel homolog
MKPWGAALGMLVAVPAVLWAQARTNTATTFTMSVDVVQVSVSVADARNHYVTSLSEQDFAVFEDGVRQELAVFTHDDLPISLSLLIDGSASMKNKLPATRAAALRFVHTLRPKDVAQVVQFNATTQILQDYTSDQKALEAALQSIQASGPTALYTALYVALKQLTQQSNRAELRRRAVVLFSDGEDTVSSVTDTQVLDLARRSEIAVYPIGLKPERQLDRERVDYLQAVHFLTAAAHETGTQPHFPELLSDLDGVYDRIAEELRTRYTLGYVSANPRRDGAWRRIVVRTPTRDDLQVRHKAGYYAARG